MRTYTYEDYCLAADVIRKQINIQPEFGLVLGSGLGQLADEVENPVIINYKDIPGWPLSTVAGHKGRLVIGTLEGKPVLVQQGRAHFYEGYSPAEVTFAVRVMICLGIKTLVVTNAAGGVNKDFRAGDIMLITDHIGTTAFAGHNPLIGPNFDQFGPRFNDMSQAYDRGLAHLAREAAAKNGIKLQEGVYCWFSGPNYETPAEIRMIRCIGGDAVGMSTVPEVIVARHGGMRVLGFSGVTNKCSDDGNAQTTHAEVLEAADVIGPKIITILRDVLKQA